VYFDLIFQKLRPYVSQHANNEEVMLKGVTTDTIGAIAQAVGPDIFRV
jgi:hypothetical protein